ncbi:MAG: hypothetical protein H0X33_14915 [Taibaiella sp.]|nr:hypothetical protein [Taibaiella sp.]
MLQKLLYIPFSICLLLTPRALKAQVVQPVWPSPEVEQMYAQGREYLSSGNFKMAIITYNHAIQLAPKQMILFRDLGNAYYLSGDYKKSIATLQPLIKSGKADDQGYEVMAASEDATGEKKKAKETLEEGLDKYKNSGILYHELGKHYEQENEPAKALETWLDGIHKDPAYHLNYYEAARTYLNTKKVVWTIIYGEIFVNKERSTPRADETKKMVLDAYKKLFYNTNSDDVPVFGANKKEGMASSFDEAVRTTLIRLSPVVSDGINTESLTMLRTRFIMEWMNTYAKRFHFSMYTYHDDMLRNGYFEAYNEWIFGKTDNLQEDEAWKKFHPDAIPSYETWAKQHPLIEEPTDYHNDGDMDGLFIKKKK